MDAAVAERAETARQRDHAVAARQQADATTAMLLAVHDFLQDDLLGQADIANQAKSDGPRDPDVKVRTLLDRASQAVSTRFSTSPAQEASVRETIGKAYMGLGLWREAETHLERSWQLSQSVYGEDAAPTLRTLNNLASVYFYPEDFAKAIALNTQALAQRRKTLGPEHAETLFSAANLASSLGAAGQLEKAAALVTAGTPDNWICSILPAVPRYCDWACRTNITVVENP